MTPRSKINCQVITPFPYQTSFHIQLMMCDYMQAINTAKEDVLGVLFSLPNTVAVAECHGVLIYLSEASGEMF